MKKQALSEPARIQGGATIWARQTVESEIFKFKPDIWFKIWFYLVNRVNFETNKYFYRGECYIRYKDISDATRATKDQIKHFLEWAKNPSKHASDQASKSATQKEPMIATRKTTRGMVVKVLKYEFFQTLDNYYSNIKADTEATQEIDIEAKQKPHESHTISKNVKNVKNLQSTASSSQPNAYGVSPPREAGAPATAGLTTSGVTPHRPQAAGTLLEDDTALSGSAEILDGEIDGGDSWAPNDNTERDPEKAKKDKRDPRVQSMFDRLCEKLKTNNLVGKDQWIRSSCKNLANLEDKLGPEEFWLRFDTLASDEFLRKNIGDPGHVFKHIRGMRSSQINWQTEWHKFLAIATALYADDPREEALWLSIERGQKYILFEDQQSIEQLSCHAALNPEYLEQYCYNAGALAEAKEKFLIPEGLTMANYDFFITVPQTDNGRAFNTRLMFREGRPIHESWAEFLTPEQVKTLAQKNFKFSSTVS